jgi:hypothetical protein
MQQMGGFIRSTQHDRVFVLIGELDLLAGSDRLDGGQA